MKLSTQQNTLVSVLQEASKFLSSRSSVPSLAGFHLVAESSGMLHIRASSGVTTLVRRIPAQVEEEGEILLPGGVFLQALKSLESGELSLSLEGGLLIIQQKKTRFEVAPLDLEAFPAIESYDGWTKMLLPNEMFMNSVRQVLVAAGVDETKPVLTGVLMELKQPNALVTTDGFRLFRVQADLATDIDSSLLVPAKSLRDLLPMFEKVKDGIIQCYVPEDKSSIVITWPDGEAQVRTIQGEFPPYRSIIPEACAFSFRVEREQLQQCLRQAMVFARDVSNIVVFEVRDGQLVMRSQKSVQGRSEVEMPISSLQGEPVRFACNGRYVTEFIASIEASEIIIQGNEALKPVLFSVPENDSLLYLIMPFKLAE